MRIIIDFEDEFNTLVTRGQIQIIGLRDIVNSIKKYDRTYPIGSV